MRKRGQKWGLLEGMIPSRDLLSLKEAVSSFREAAYRNSHKLRHYTQSLSKTKTGKTPAKRQLNKKFHHGAIAMLSFWQKETQFSLRMYIE